MANDQRQLHLVDYSHPANLRYVKTINIRPDPTRLSFGLEKQEHLVDGGVGDIPLAGKGMTAGQRTGGPFRMGAEEAESAKNGRLQMRSKRVDLKKLGKRISEWKTKRAD